MRLAAVTAAMLIASPTFAEEWVLDDAHSIITFSADHLGFSVVQGRFTDFEADIDFDPDDIEATEIEFAIQAESINTDWPERDKHIRSPDFLNVEEFPEITFTSTEIEQTGDDTARITGDLTMIGETQEVTFDATLNKLGPSPFNPDQTIAGFTITGEIERADWGMTFGGANFAAVVPVRIDLEMSPTS